MDRSRDLTSLPPLDRLEALKNWENGSRSRMAPTIAPTRDLLTRIGNPHKAFNAVHVTGTKGKGSVCALLETALHRAGLKVGRYASPHILSVCERISVRGRPIPQSALDTALERVLDVRDQASLAGTAAKDATWFDVFTAAAFLHFAQMKLDWVVAEVGLGGRLDSTNVLDSRVCVITNIGLEHTDVLGDTRMKIAREKAGIIKPGSVVVTGLREDDDAHEVVASHARKQLATLVTVPAETRATQQNVALAATVLDSMGSRGVTGPLDGNRPLHHGLLDASAVRAAALPGRFELLEHRSGNKRTTILLDGAHVDIALKAVFDEVRDAPWSAAPLTVLFALGRDKNPRRMLEQLRGRAQHVVFTSLEDRTCIEPAELMEYGREAGLSCTEAVSPEEGIRECLDRAGRTCWILVTGSLYLIGPVRRALEST